MKTTAVQDRPYLRMVLVLVLMLFLLQSAVAATLTGWAKMPTETYGPGPSTGRFYDSSRKSGDKQAIQGFSAVLAGSDGNHFYFLSDNGFGRKDNSADALLRLHEIQLDFQSTEKSTRRAKPTRHLTFHDCDKKLTFPIQADYENYYDRAGNVSVAPEIRRSRLLTGADLDPESIRCDKNGNLWLGDEFGPYLIKTNSSGKVLHAEFPLPGLSSPDNFHRSGFKSNVAPSGGIEGMAINATGDRLFVMLEKAVSGDSDKRLRILRFDINRERFEADFHTYRLDDEGTGIGDLVAVNEHQFLVIERNSDDHSGGKPYKKVILIDTRGVKSGDDVKKVELVDLMDIEDPDDLDSDGMNRFSFSFSTIESLLILDESTLMLCNDNNFEEFTHFIRIRLDQPLPLARFNQTAVDTTGWTQSGLGFWRLHLMDTGLAASLSASMWFVALIAAGFRFLKSGVTGDPPFFWLTFCFVLFSVGLGTHLDVLRPLHSQIEHYRWYEGLRVDRLPLMAVAALGGLALLGFQRIHHAIRCGIITQIGMMILLGVVSARDLSFHRADRVLHQSIGAFEVHRVFELCALALLITGLLSHGARSTHLRTRVAEWQRP
jgi:hypothetical protein